MPLLKCILCGKEFEANEDIYGWDRGETKGICPKCQPAHELGRKSPISSYLRKLLKAKKMYQQKIGLEFNKAKDKRIVFQSVFSSLCNLCSDPNATAKTADALKEKAFKIVEELYKKYPFPDETAEFKEKDVSKSDF